jgi:membrane protein required for colicin V production
VWRRLAAAWTTRSGKKAMSLTILDVIVIVVVVISAVLAMVRGFVREVLSIASWAAAAIVAYLLYKPLVPMVQPYLPSATAQAIAAAAAVFFVALIVATFITTKIADFVIDSRVGAFDRALGFMFGAARGILLLVIALLFFDWLVQPSPAWVANAQSRPVLEDLGARLMAALPEDIEESIMRRLRGEGEGDEAAPNEAAPPPEQGAAVDPTYGGSTRQGLDRLIDNTGVATRN